MESMDEQTRGPHPLLSAAARLFGFVLIGVLIAFIGELQFSVFIRGDWANLLGSVVFNALYLTGAYGVTRLIFAMTRRWSTAFLFSAVLAAVVGLGVEWFVIGNSPWGNPAASDVGMAAYWACMVVIPLVLTDPDGRLRPVRRFITGYAVVYTVIILAGQAMIPSAEGRFVFHILAVIAGYVGLLALTVVKALRAMAGPGKMADNAGQPPQVRQAGGIKG